MLCLELDPVSRDYQYSQLTRVQNIVWILCKENNRELLYQIRHLNSTEKIHYPRHSSNKIFLK